MIHNNALRPDFSSTDIDLKKERFLTNIDYTMVGEFPAGLQPEDAKGAALGYVKISKGGVGYMISLQRELVETRQ